MPWTSPLGQVYSYDLYLSSFTTNCGGSQLDWVRFQAQACETISVPSDFSTEYPKLPLFCTTPYLNDTGGPDLVFDESRSVIRLHIFDWDFSPSPDSLQGFSGSSFAYVQNADKNLVTDLYAYAWTSPSTDPGPRSKMCRYNQSSQPGGLMTNQVDCSTDQPAVCAQQILKRLSTACPISAADLPADLPNAAAQLISPNFCPEVLNTFWQVSHQL